MSKKINDLKVKLGAKLDEKRTILEQVIAENRAKDEDETKKCEALDKEIKNIEAQIRDYESLEELNQRTSEPVEEVRTEEKPVSYGVQFRDFIKNAIEKNGERKFEYRADPILATTETGIINKTVASSVDILTSPGEAFLRSIGVTFFPGLTGNFEVPAMGEDTATFPGEDASAASADMTPTTLTLAARRVSHSQAITKETLAQTNPGIYSGILQNLVNGVWNAVTNDVFDTLETDAASYQNSHTAGGLAFGDLVGLEASIGGLNIGAGAYVTTPSVKAYLKQKIELGSTVGPAIWKDNEVNGYPAYGVPAANTNSVYFGDFSKCAVGQWGDLEIVVDPYSQAKQGRIVLTIVGLFDTGCYNQRGICWLDDVSAGY